MADHSPTIARKFSSDIVTYLNESRSKTLKDIGKLIKCSESFLSLVKRGKRSLTIEHLIALETSLDEPLPLLILEASRGWMPEHRQRQYRRLYQILTEGWKAHPRSTRKKDAAGR